MVFSWQRCWAWALVILARVLAIISPAIHCALCNQQMWVTFCKAGDSELHCEPNDIEVITKGSICETCADQLQCKIKPAVLYCQWMLFTLCVVHDHEANRHKTAHAGFLSAEPKAYHIAAHVARNVAATKLLALVPSWLQVEHEQRDARGCGVCQPASKSILHSTKAATMFHLIRPSAGALAQPDHHQCLSSSSTAHAAASYTCMQPGSNHLKASSCSM